MEIAHTTNELRAQMREWRRIGEHIALVPTMGNLHDGHLSLVALAREHADRVVVSIFVNPTQFSEDDDFDQYPRTLERDKMILKRCNVDLVFIPDDETIYPFGIDNATSVTVPILTEELCGIGRPGHFDGVTSVVSRLFSLVQPDVAVFGQKDYQQWLVIRRMAEDLSLPIKIFSGQTIREEDGLALSSRNQYLSEEDRMIASELYATLTDIGSELQAGNRNFAQLEEEAAARLNDKGFRTEYFSIRRADDLAAPDRDDDELVVLAAAELGKARLIDNLVVAI